MQILQKYFPDLLPVQLEQFTKLDQLYRDWNSKINLISRKDISQLYERHVLHSLAIAKVISFKNTTTIMDAGTGGGFPGLPLAILFPQARFFLVDSIAKKIKVVEAINHELGLNNCYPYCGRFEKFNQPVDFVISRAVTELPKFINMVNNKISKTGINSLKNGILYLKGGDFTEELQRITYKHKIFNIHDFFEEEYFQTKKVVYIKII